MLLSTRQSESQRKHRIIMEQLEERVVFDAAIHDVLSSTVGILDDVQTLGWDMNGQDHDFLITQTQTQEQMPPTTADDFVGRLLPVDQDPFAGRWRGVNDDPHARVLQITNYTSDPGTLYLLFNKHNDNCTYGSNGQYTVDDFPGFSQDPDNCQLISRQLPPNSLLTLDFNKTNGLIDFGLSLNTKPHTGCYVTTAEFTLHNLWAYNSTWHDTFDISLVNGFNYSMTLDTPYSDTIPVTSMMGNGNTAGVFGLGNDSCSISCNVPEESPGKSCSDVWGSANIAKEAHPCSEGATNTCPTGCTPPAIFCQLDRDHSLAGNKNTFVLAIGK